MGVMSDSDPGEDDPDGDEDGAGYDPWADADLDDWRFVM